MKIITLAHVLKPEDLAEAKKDNEILSASFFTDFFQTVGDFENKKVSGKRELKREHSNREKSTGEYKCRDQTRKTNTVVDLAHFSIFNVSL